MTKICQAKRGKFIDLPRLSKRITIIDNRENKNILLVSNGLLPQKNDKNNDNDEKNEKNEEQRNVNWNRIKNILLCLAEYSMDGSDETKAVYDALQKEMKQNANRHGQFDFELRGIFEKNKLLQSQVTRIVNVCTQNVIFSPYLQLLQNYFVPNGFDKMRDVRTEYGWQIFIYFNPKDVIRILHKRQCQYNQPPDDETKHFLVNWELDMSFTPKMEKCNSVFVRTNGIEFLSENAEQKYKYEVKTKLSGGSLIFH